ncbi:odorant receptor 13a-like [Aphidius gifuensis]|uniref:odorant receptor 13a-like n=1 Tax=Aphidius gifuensis TaxID=684658 RepID=UPI001CDCAF0C|nr:odorant receptor 13a-like [Aphidius gifuensis]
MKKNNKIERHVSLRMTRLFMKFIGMWYPKNSRDSSLSNLIIIYTIIAQVIGLIIMLIDIYYIRSDLRAIAFNLPVTITIIQELIKMTKFLCNIKDVQRLNEFTEKNFWKLNYDKAELKILEKCNQRCILSCEHDKYNRSSRQLPFNMYFKFAELTPYYELCYFIQSAATIGVTVCTTAFISHLFTLNIYAAGQFQILQRKMTMSHCQNENKEPNSLQVATSSFDNLKICIKQHQMLIKYINMIENLYNPITFILALGAVCTICLTGFQLVVGVDMTFHRTALSFEFFVASVIMLFMACYCCQAIIIESLAVGDAAYAATWYTPDVKDQKAYKQALMFIMLRSKKNCIITVGKLAPMSIEIFTVVFNKSMSFFTVLRRTLEE